MKFKLLMFTCLTFLASCQFDPYADEMTIIKPKFKDIPGIYVFERQTLDSKLTEVQTRQAKIILKPDSTFNAIDVPNFVGRPDFSYRGVISAKGKWAISTNGGVANGTGGSDSIWGIDLNTLPTDLQHIEFLGQKPPYKLIVTYGDPDSGTVMIFKKL